MVIQCDQCRTRFRLDDAKLQGGSAKVRCSKCKHVFIVYRESPADDSQLTLAAAEGGPAAAAQQAVAFETASFELAAAAGAADKVREPGSQGAAVEEAAGISPTAAPGPATGEEGFDFGAFAFEEEGDAAVPPSQAEISQPAAGTAEGDFVLDDFAADIPAEESEIKVAQPVEEKSIDFDELAFTGDGAQKGAAEAADFSIDFGDLALSDDTSSAGGSSLSAREKAEFAGQDDLLADTLGLDSDFSDFAGTLPPEPTGEGLDLAFADEIDFAREAATESVEKPETDEFGELDFGDLTMPEETAAGGQPAAPPQAAVSPAAEEREAPALLVQADEELPPLSIPSRRKGGTLFPTAIVVVAAVVIIALTGFGLYFLSGPEAFSKVGLGFLVEWAGLKPQEEGTIAIQGVTGSYVVNSEGGELFVIKGQVVNNYKKPRASIQVKGLLLNGKGEVLQQKSAYCGNDLTTEQLKTLPLAKINETMNNQFGDSLANLGVQPNKAIPFVLAFDKVPKESVDFGVQVAGSTVAAQ